MADLYLVRHGQTELNVQNILQGGHDSPLTARGREQALMARAAFAARGVAFDHAYSSPLGRARHTAELIVGESEGELQSRMVAALSHIMARPQHDCVLAVSHGSACQEFLEYVTGRGELPDNGAVLHFGYCDGAFSLLDW